MAMSITGKLTRVIIVLDRIKNRDCFLCLKEISQTTQRQSITAVVVQVTSISTTTSYKISFHTKQNKHGCGSHKYISVLVSTYSALVF